MKIADMLVKMVDFYEGDHHDINHFMKVWGFARTIGECEGLDAETQFTLEAAAIVHDIACPLCRQRYGFADGKHQEEEGPALVLAFFESTDVEPWRVERICWLVGHHHTYTDVDGIDHRILLEADFLVNADEQGESPEAIRAFEAKVFRTRAGTELLHSIYLRDE